MSDALLSQAEIDALLCQLSEPDGEAVWSDSDEVMAADATEMQRATPIQGKTAKPSHPNLERILDIPLHVTVSLGEIRKKVQDVLALHPGTIVELERLASEPVDIFINGKLIARGEVVVVDERFGVRVTHIISPHERIKKIV
jgi:flagellar motor switch protein FliN/FliY